MGSGVRKKYIYSPEYMQNPENVSKYPPAPWCFFAARPVCDTHHAASTPVPLSIYVYLGAGETIGRAEFIRLLPPAPAAAAATSRN